MVRTMLNALLHLLCAVNLVGCAVLDVGRKSNSLSERNHTVVALDFVSALSGLRGHHPANTMLQVRPANHGFGKTLLRELRDAGYGLQTITQEASGPMLVSYQADSFENSSYRSVAYRLRVGSVELGREYEVRAGRVFPVSSLSVKGIEIASQALDQSMFERIDESTVHGTNTAVGERSPSNSKSSNDSGSIVPVLATAVPERLPVHHESAMNGATETTQPWISEGSAANTGMSRAGDALVAATDRSKPQQNMLVLGASNYQLVFSDYRVVEQDVVVFANDSMNLGRQGKQQVKRLFDIFDEKTDLISIVGCSHGTTHHKDGNKALALGRAQRVMEELLSHHAPRNRLFDEGCWAGVTQKSLPSRGVIVSLRRSKTAT